MAEPTPTCSKFFLFLVATWFGQLRGGLRFLGFASSRATEIYGDLAKIYGASPQFFATVSGLSFAHKTQRAKSEINVFSIEDRVLHACRIRRMRTQDPQWVLLPQCRVVGKTHPTAVRPLWRPTGLPR